MAERTPEDSDALRAHTSALEADTKALNEQGGAAERIAQVETAAVLKGMADAIWGQRGGPDS